MCDWRVAVLVLAVVCGVVGAAGRSRGKPPPEGATIVREVVRFKPVRLPAQFAHYDTDGDGGIRVGELAAATSTAPGDCEEPFLLADINKDGVIDVNEFEKAPWRLDGKRGKRIRKKQHRRKKKSKQQEDAMKS